VSLPRRLPRLAVLSHSAIEPTYQRKWAAVAAAGYTVRLLVPHRWPETGRWQRGRVRTAGRLSVGILPAVFAGRVARWFPRGLGAALDRYRPDVILAEEEPYGLACALAARAAGRLKIPFLFYTWENLRRPYRWPQDRLLRVTVRAAAGGIAGNHAGLAIMRGWGLRGSAAVIPQYGVDGASFRPLSQPSCRRRLNLPVRGRLIGFIGRLLPEKGLETLLASVRMLPEEVGAVIIGNGPEEPVLRRTAAPLGPRVRFLGAVPRAAVPVAMGALDVLVLPSRTTPVWTEQFGRVLAEAQACGRWAVGSDSGEIPHVLGSPRFVFPEGQAGALARRVRPLLKRRPPPALRRRALARFSESAVAEATVRFLAGVVRRSRG